MRLLALTLTLWLALPVAADAQLRLTGRVIANDASGSPVDAAELAIVPSGPRTRADSAGRFGFRVARDSVLTLRVTRLGFRPLVIDVEPAADTVLDLTITLEPVPERLDERRVDAVGGRLRTTGFVERRERGIGTFYDSTAIADLAKDLRLTTLMQQTRGARIARSRNGSSSFLIATRGTTTPWGGSGPCYAAIILDGTWLYRGGPGSVPIDLNSIPLNQIVGVEYYRGNSSVPQEFNTLGSECGVLVLWTG